MLKNSQNNTNYETGWISVTKITSPKVKIRNSKTLYKKTCKMILVYTLVIFKNKDSFNKKIIKHTRHKPIELWV